MDKLLFASLETMFQSLVTITNDIPSLAEEASSMAIRLIGIREVIVLDLREWEINSKARALEAPCVKELEEYVVLYQDLMLRANAITRQY